MDTRNETAGHGTAGSGTAGSRTAGAASDAEARGGAAAGGLIDGVAVKPLRVIPDERGWLMEIIRRDDPFYRQFGQVYLTVVYPGVVKGWHWHKLQTDHFCVLKGMAKVVLFDRRDGSPTHGRVNEFFIGERNPSVVVIPNGVLHGMKGIGTEPALLLNLTTEPYNHATPDEYRVPPHDAGIPYDWNRVDG